MKQLHNIMFPTLDECLWGNIDLNECVKVFHPDWMTVDNPLLDPGIQIAFINDMHKRMKRDYSFGGYMEDRSVLWRGHYHKPNKMIHLGIDFNVPAGTEVRLPFHGDIVYVGVDKDQNGGWGGRLDFYSQSCKFYFIIGHLDPDSIHQFHPSKEPRIWYGGYPQCYNIGLVGSSDKNGGWYPHVHLQCVSKKAYKKYKNPMKIDGYGKASAMLCKRFPNPTQYV